MPPDSYKKYVRANEEAWNEVTPLHQSYRTGQEDFFRNGGSTLDRFELENLPDLHGKKLAHLCCNCGQDTLSLANLGASCSGFDQSEVAVSEARKLSRESGVEAEFVKTDVLEIPESYNGKFDIVYISIGVLVWIPDIPLLMKNASKLLVPGGELFLYDQHPVCHMFDQYGDDPLKVQSNYFATGPSEYRGLDYLGGKEYDAKPNFQFMVRLGDLLNGLADNNMRLAKFLEFKHSIEDARPSKDLLDSSGQRRYLGNYSPLIPNMMLIEAIRMS